MLTPRILGQLIDEYDETRRGTKKQDDFSYKAAKYFKENPLTIVTLLFIGATAICFRAYLMHTAGLTYFYYYITYETIYS